MYIACVHNVCTCNMHTQHAQSTCIHTTCMHNISGKTIAAHVVHSWWLGARQKSTGVQVVTSPTSCGGRNTDVTVVSNTRPRKRRGPHQVRRAARLATETQQVQQRTDSIKSASKGFWCPDCCRFFQQHKSLQNHRRKHQCQGGSVMFKRSKTSFERITNTSTNSSMIRKITGRPIREEATYKVKRPT